ncbi:MAG: hypothetical protein S4CHLAM45_07150 [Chlamydiales bacterium]|nr:hypothetical protein [Chlamydiales bacterium]MCH9620268.1 hypothetical protein [Chlamydiales bacterium]MCH9622822.1 hypothetical protein [Chlamydiales bacterium]
MRSAEQIEQIERAFHGRMIWTRFITVFLGIWMLTAPITFGYIQHAIHISDWISGALLIVFGFLAMSFRTRGWIWGSCFVGIWLQLAPLVFWTEAPVAYLNDTIIGVMAIGLCVLVPLRAPEFEIGPQIPHGWSYNPSSWQQRVPIIFFGTVGWFVARYLCAYQLHFIDSVWGPSGGEGTKKVITSLIAKNFPVPDAGLGALAYSLEVIMAAKGGVRRWHTMPWLVIVFGILVVPLGFTSIVLVMLQPLVVGAWCALCLIIATCMLIMLALAVDEVILVCQYIRHELKTSGRGFWDIVIKGSCYEQDEVNPRTPSTYSNLWRFLKTMVIGVRLPWNLLITAFAGAWLLFDNEILGFTGMVSKATDVLGALTVVFSIISWAEVARALRFMNILLMVLLVLASIFLPGASWGSVIQGAIVGAVVIVLSLFKGAKIKEQYGTWQKLIF